ncbi:hypothetical protein [Roseomonas sp. BN140053]|uniref:hypothetical protein n=1 Tax=Roseomonas sp. BN140053 TaxID=3391898 RepID=UPI0039EA3FD0
MRRATELRLVLLGGGVLLLAGGCDDRREACERARAAGSKDAAQVCEGSSSGSASSSSGSGAHGYGWSSWSSRRGGFGSTASHFSGGG